MSGKLRRDMLRDPAHFLSCGFGSGLVPGIPGTAGTVVAIPLALLMQRLPDAGAVALCSVMFVAGCFICERTAKALGKEDPAIVVWDEITGYCIAMAAVPASALTIAMAFVVFRALDILKPFPIGWVEKKVSGGFGIMLDDAVAGILTNVILVFFLSALPL